MNDSVNKPSAVETQVSDSKPVVLNKSQRCTKTPHLLALLSIALLGTSIYYAFYAKGGVFDIWENSYTQQRQIKELYTQNNQLKNQIHQLTLSQQALQSTINSLSPNQSTLVLNQVNSLVSGANQSLYLYHDYAGAIKMLSYAKQVLATSNDPVFSTLKLNLAQDLDNLQAQNSFDNNLVAGELESLINTIPQLQLLAPVSHPSSTTIAELNWWQRLLENAKASLSGLVKVTKTNPGAERVLLPENELMIRQQLQLNLLNARQALITRNQNLWLTSLQSSENLLRNYFILNVASQKALSITGQLGKVELSESQVNLDLTMQALVKTEQLMQGK